VKNQLKSFVTDVGLTVTAAVAVPVSPASQSTLRAHEVIATVVPFSVEDGTRTHALLHRFRLSPKSFAVQANLAALHAAFRHGEWGAAGSCAFEKFARSHASGGGATEAIEFHRSDGGQGLLAQQKMDSVDMGSTGT